MDEWNCFHIYICVPWGSIKRCKKPSKLQMTMIIITQWGMPIFIYIFTYVRYVQVTGRARLALRYFWARVRLSVRPFMWPCVWPSIDRLSRAINKSITHIVTFTWWSGWWWWFYRHFESSWWHTHTHIHTHTDTWHVQSIKRKNDY